MCVVKIDDILAKKYLIDFNSIDITLCLTANSIEKKLLLLMQNFSSSIS